MATIKTVSKRKEAARALLVFFLTFLLAFQLLGEGIIAWAESDEADAGTLTAVASAADAQQLIDDLEEGLDDGSLTVTSIDSVAAVHTGGIYRLVGDIESDEALIIDIEADEVAVIDLNGHTLKVTGDTSAIDASGSLGTVAVIDSTQLDGDDADDEDAGAVVLAKADADYANVAAVRYDADADAVEGLDEGRQPALVLAGVTLKVSGTDDAPVQDAAAVHVKNLTAYLGAGLSYSEKHADAGYDLFAGTAEAFTFMKGFTADDALAVGLRNGQDGDVFATKADGLSAAKAAVLVFDYVESDGLTCAFDGNESFVLNEVSATAAADSQDDEADAGTASATADEAASDEGDAGATATAAERKAVARAASSSSGADLNELWEESGTGSSYTITEGGTYYLSADLTTTMPLSIDADGAQVTIEFNGHTLEIGGSNGVGIRVKAASGVTLTGDGSRASTLFLTGSKITRIVDSQAGNLVVQDLTLKSETDDAHTSLTDLTANGVYASAGTVKVLRTTVDVDLGNQGNTTTLSNNATKNGPTGIYLGASVTSASVTDSDIAVQNSRVVTVSDADDVTGVGFAKGLYSQSTGAISLNGCTVEVNSPLGSAIGAWARFGSLVGDISFELDASLEAIGFYAPAAGSWTLDGKLSSASANASAECVAALYAPVENGFVFGSGFSGSSLAVWVGASEDDANAPGAYVGTFDSSVTASKRTDIVAMLENALGSNASCSLTCDSNGVYFVMDSAKAAARVVDGTKTTAYYSVAAAVAAAESGQTVQLLRDAGSIAFGKGSAGESYVLDLNGCTADALVCSTKADLEVISSKEGGGIAASGDTTAAVRQTGAGALTLTGIDISCSQASQQANGVYASSAGALTLENVTINVSAGRSSAYGVRQTGGSSGAVSVTGSTIDVSALQTSVTVYGIATANKTGTTVSRCKVTVDGSDATTRGIDVSANLTLTGQAGTDTVTVTTSSASSSVAGVYATAGDTMSLSTVRISVSGSSDASSYACLGGKATSSVDPTWSLDGACRLDSSTDTEIVGYACPVELAKGFSVTGGCIHIVASNKGTGAAAVLADGLDANALTSYFAAGAASFYEGYTVVAGDGTLDWTHKAVARNENSGSSYVSLSAAIDDAAAGDTVTLLADTAVSEVLSVERALTIDLAGHTATVSPGSSAVAGSSNAGGALAVTDGAQLTLTDSAGTGSLSFEMGLAKETNSAKTYQGIAVSGGSSLIADDVAISVHYTGASSYTPVITLYAIAVANGSATLTGTTSLDVQAAPEDDAFGASTVAGIWVSSSSAGSVDVGSNASISVRNNACQVTSGSSDYPGYSGDTGANSSSNAKLVEVTLEEGSELYEQVQEAFLQHAAFDSSTDTQGKVYDARIYYATALELDSGMTVWAYSDRIDDGSAGKLDSIVATHVFVRAGVDTPLNAYGIYAQSAYAGSVSMTGAIDAETTAGNAYGVYESSGGTWQVGKSKIKTSCSDEPYVAASSSKFDLRDFIELSDMTSTITYPKSGSFTLLEAVAPNALAVQTPDGDTEARDSALTEDELYAAVYPMMSEDIDVTFKNIRSSSGSLQSEVTRSVSYGGTMADSYSAPVLPSDYTRNGVTYRFVGWRLSGDSTNYYAYAPDTLYASLVFDANISGATDGSVTFTAVYVPVAAGQHLVTFHVEDRISAYALADGRSASFKDCYDASSSGSLVPDKLTSEDGCEYTFAGWVSGDSDECVVQDDDDLHQALPAASKDVEYTARFNEIADEVKLSLTYRSTASSTYAAKTVSTTCKWGDSVMAVAEGKAGAIGSEYTCEGTTYTLTGWSPRMSDVEPLYTSEVDVDWDYASGNWSDTNYFFATYDTADQMVTVRFHANGQLIGSAEVASGATVRSAVSAAGISTSGLTSSDGALSFRGWNTSEDATSVLTNLMVTVGSVSGGAETLDLYAIWKKEYVVTFHDDDGSLLGEYAVLEGTTVMSSNPDFEITIPKSKRSDFVGWVDADGNEFSTTETAVIADTDIYASYLERSAGTGTISKSGSGAVSLNSTGGAGTLGSLDTAGLTGSVTSLSSAGNAALASADNGSLAENGASLKSAGNADASSGSADASGSGADDSAASGSTLTARIALAVLIGAFAGLCFLIGRWFWLRRKNYDDDEEDILLTQMQSVRF